MHWGRWVIITALLASTSVKAQSPNVTGNPVLHVSPQLRMHTKVEDHDMAAFLVANKMETDADGKVILRGLAEVRRIDSVAKGDYIDYQKSTGLVRVRGNGLLMRDSSIVESPSFDYNLNSESGQVEYPEFWLGGSGGSGTANEAEIFSSDHMQLKEVVYNGCPCPEPAWHIKSPQIDLHFNENEGVARHGVLYFKRAPILYAPWLSFPLRKERKSGFLVPTYGMSSKSGFDFSLPYYLNLAPNYDATITPRYLSKRGLQLGSEFRYLQPDYNGTISGTYLAKDKEKQIKRWLISAQHSHRLGAGFSANLRLNRVSDGDYFRDISNIGLAESSTTTLSSRASLHWSGSKYINVSLAATKYQTLQDRTGSYRRPPFDKLPELTINASRYNWNGLDLVSESQITRFHMPHFIYGTHEYPYRNQPYQSYDGTRYKSYNTISLPIIKAGWYIKPKVGVHLTHYETNWKGFGPAGAPWNNLTSSYRPGPKNESRVVPIVSVDSGMFFERDTNLFGQQSLQTLEPRLYYLRVPYKDQSTLPIYDTSLASFNISQAFSENIFSGGWDRISDADQLTIGLTSRWLDADTGFERITLTAAQRLYFRDQTVGLHPNHLMRTKAKSDYLFGANAALTDKFSVRFDAQYNPESNKRNRMAAGLRWSPKRLATVSLSYRFDRDPSALLYHHDPDPNATKENTSLMAQWPITNKWYGVGRYDYSFKEKRSTQSILGLEYKGDCCWSARVVMQRYAVSKKDVNTAVFFQLELQGLGSLGTDAMGVLSDRIAGYQKITPPLHEQTTFERYK